MKMDDELGVNVDDLVRKPPYGNFHFEVGGGDWRPGKISASALGPWFLIVFKQLECGFKARRTIFFWDATSILSERVPNRPAYF